MYLAAERALREGALDLGLALSWVGTARHTSGREEETLVAQRGTGWAFFIELGRRRDGLSLKLSAIAPGESLLRVKLIDTRSADLELAVLRALRDVQRSTLPPSLREGAPSQLSEPGVELSPDSDGRAYLAVTGALVGGYVGYALEHVTGSGNSRILYPLMTLGAGVGVAASLVAADEWRVTRGQAWYLSSSTFWSTAAALLIAQGVELEDPSHQHAYGLLGTATGLSLGTLAVATSDIGQGSALLLQSGALFGGLFGVLAERTIEPNLSEPPTLGMGLGIATGALGAGFLATQLPAPQPARVVYVDLAALLGALTGAAVSTPVIVGEDITQTESRIWLASIFAGTVVGGVLGYALTSPPHPVPELAKAARHRTSNLRVRPSIVPVSFGQPRSAPAWALAVQGNW